MDFSQQLWIALAGAALAAAGYLARLAIDWHQKRRETRAALVARLQRLSSLLGASDGVFKAQKDLSVALCKELERQHPDLCKNARGREEIMTRCHGVMDKAQLEAHSVIRAFSAHSMMRVNQSISDWLRDDTFFKSRSAPVSNCDPLADGLVAFETHLLLWLAKAEHWLPENPAHALVYLDDEKKHGLGFPSGLDEVVKTALQELKTLWQ